MTRHSRGLVLGLALAMAGIGAAAEPADAQIRDRVQDRARQQAERRAEDRAAEAVDRALDGVEGAVVCVVTDRECIRSARDEGQEVVYADEDGNVMAAPEARDGPGALRPGEGAWAHYDFVPGERVLLADDFTVDNVGDFPRRLEFKRGNLEVVEWEGDRYLRATSRSELAVPLPEILPERFTVEFDYTGPASGAPSRIFFSDEGQRRPHAFFNALRGGLDGGGIDAQGRPPTDLSDQIIAFRIMVDGTHVKVYMDETRVANVPNADLGRSNAIVLSLQPYRQPVLVSNLRVAAGGRDLYDALEAEGRVVTRGILFDTGSDRLRPESTPTLREISEMLQRRPELRLRIEGHTDSVGSAEFNQALSELRAEAVREHLVRTHGIDGARLEGAGLGESQPRQSNDTPEGRQNNRRVELVRL